MEKDLFWVWLSIVPGIGIRKYMRLVEHFGDPRNIWMASKAELKGTPLLNDELVEVLKNNKYMDEAEKHFENIHKNNIKVITIKDKKYPLYLKDIYDPPVVLYCKGIIKSDEKTIAVVGSRRASEYGLKMAEKLSYELAGIGITIVSGMARGIDSYAHRGALRAEGRTIAVLGCGPDSAYPAENRQLMEKITGLGMVISEYLPGTPPIPCHFPERNRIISGASLGVVVVEANERSGSLITADFALEQGREVFAVPGNVNSSTSRGANKLIKEGAKMVTCIGDILEELKAYGFDNMNNKEEDTTHEDDIKRKYIVKGLDKDERKIAKCLETDAMHVDIIAARCGISIQLVNSILVMLELKGVVEQLPGKIFRLRE